MVVDMENKMFEANKLAYETMLGLYSADTSGKLLRFFITKLIAISKLKGWGIDDENKLYVVTKAEYEKLKSNNIDLINGKTMWCPKCGKSFTQYDGKVNGETAHVTTYCEDCNKHYHWVAYISKNTKEHKVTMFKEYYKAD